jgi:hypothetical protein
VGSTITLGRKEQQKGLDFVMIDLVDKDNRKTRVLHQRPLAACALAGSTKKEIPAVWP